MYLHVSVYVELFSDHSDLHDIALLMFKYGNISQQTNILSGLHMKHNMRGFVMTIFKFFHKLLLNKYCFKRFIRNSSMQEGVTRTCGLKCLYYNSILTWYKSTEVDENVKIPKSHPVSVQLVPFVLTVLRQPQFGLINLNQVHKHLFFVKNDRLQQIIVLFAFNP